MKHDVVVNSVSTACRKNLVVVSAACDLEGAVDELRDAVVALEQHLEPLLSPDRPCEKGLDRTQGVSEIDERIRSQADAIRSRSLRIYDLIERL